MERATQRLDDAEDATMNEAWHGEEVPEEVVKSVRSGRKGLWIALALAVCAAGAVGWWWMRSQVPPPPAPAPIAEAPPEAAPVVPPKLSLADGEALLKQIAARLSSAPELQSWLGQEDIVRRLVAATNLVTEGKSPSSVLGFLKPNGTYAVVKKHRKVFTSPKSGARYDVIARIVTGIDPDGVGKAYGEPKPYLESAYAEIGPAGKSFDGVLHSALHTLESTPIPAQEPELKAKGLGWAYADPQLESLGGGQKQLLRLGLAHARGVQTWLKKVDDALPPTSAAR
jgi:hypothetical protein